MTEPKPKVFRAYNITHPWAQAFSYTIDIPQWSFEDVLIAPKTAADVPWKAAKAILGKGGESKVVLLTKSNVIHEYARAVAFAETLEKILKSCEKFVAIITHGNAKWAAPHLTPGNDVQIICNEKSNGYCVMLPASKCPELLNRLTNEYTFDLAALLNSYNPTIKP